MNKEGWFQYTICEQMSNIGADVRHYIDALDNYRSGKSEEDYSDFYYQKVLQYIDIIKDDPKNKNRSSELEDCKEELRLYKEGIFSTEYITDYWDQYTAACAFRPQH